MEFLEIPIAYKPEDVQKSKQLYQRISDLKQDIRVLESEQEALGKAMSPDIRTFDIEESQLIRFLETKCFKSDGEYFQWKRFLPEGKDLFIENFGEKKYLVTPIFVYKYDVGRGPKPYSFVRVCLSFQTKKLTMWGCDYRAFLKFWGSEILLDLKREISSTETVEKDYREEERLQKERAEKDRRESELNMRRIEQCNQYFRNKREQEEYEKNNPWRG